MDYSADEDRQYPFVNEEHYSEEDVYIIDIPEGYEVENQPSNLEPLNSPFGHYKLHVDVKDKQVICTRQLEVKLVQVPAERFEEVRDFYNQVIKNDKLKLVLVKKKT